MTFFMAVVVWGVAFLAGCAIDQAVRENWPEIVARLRARFRGGA